MCKNVEEGHARAVRPITQAINVMLKVCSGGNDASVICPDVDIAKVAPLVTNGAFRNAGQVSPTP